MSDLPAPLLAELEAGVGLERLAALAGVSVSDAQEAEELGLLPPTVRNGERLFGLPAFRALKTADRLETPSDGTPASVAEAPAPLAPGEAELARLRDLRAALNSAGERLKATADQLEERKRELEAQRNKVRNAAEVQEDLEEIAALKEQNRRRSEQLVARTTALRSAGNFRAVSSFAKAAVRRSKAKKLS
jgi:DNA-binding transcriptional MerR regulator